MVLARERNPRPQPVHGILIRLSSAELLRRRSTRRANSERDVMVFVGKARTNGIVRDECDYLSQIKFEWR